MFLFRFVDQAKFARLLWWLWRAQCTHTQPHQKDECSRKRKKKFLVSVLTVCFHLLVCIVFVFQLHHLCLTWGGSMKQCQCRQTNRICFFFSSALILFCNKRNKRENFMYEYVEGRPNDESTNKSFASDFFDFSQIDFSLFFPHCRRQRVVLGSPQPKIYNRLWFRIKHFVYHLNHVTFPHRNSFRLQFYNNLSFSRWISINMTRKVKPFMESFERE